MTVQYIYIISLFYKFNYLYRAHLKLQIVIRQGMVKVCEKYQNHNQKSCHAWHSKNLTG